MFISTSCCRSLPEKFLPGLRNELATVGVGVMASSTRTAIYINWKARFLWKTSFSFLSAVDFASQLNIVLSVMSRLYK